MQCTNTPRGYSYEHFQNTQPECRGSPYQPIDTDFSCHATDIADTGRADNCRLNDGLTATRSDKLNRQNLDNYLINRLRIAVQA